MTDDRSVITTESSTTSGPRP